MDGASIFFICLAGFFPACLLGVAAISWAMGSVARASVKAEKEEARSRTAQAEAEKARYEYETAKLRRPESGTSSA